MNIPIPLMIVKLHRDKNIVTLMVVVICAMNAEVVTSFVVMCVCCDFVPDALQLQSVVAPRIAFSFCSCSTLHRKQQT